MDFECKDRKETMCNTRDYGANKYENPCYHCCFRCFHAIQMDCSGVCSKVAKHYYPEEE
jgi:hypothetical protein